MGKLSVGTLLHFRLKYWPDCHEMLCGHSWPSEGEPCIGGEFDISVSEWNILVLLGLLINLEDLEFFFKVPWGWILMLSVLFWLSIWGQQQVRFLVLQCKCLISRKWTTTSFLTGIHVPQRMNHINYPLWTNNKEV